MPRPSCAIFSPFFQSPSSLPSAGYLIRARFSFSIFSATSFDGALPSCALQTRWVSSWSRRSSPACPFALNEALSIAEAFAAVSSFEGAVAQPTTANTTKVTASIVLALIARPSAFDRRRIERRAVRIAREEQRQRDGRVRPEYELGE